MSKHILKSNKGSTLVMVLVILSVLGLLGASILSLGITHYKIKIIDQRAKKAFYLAESGIDEAAAVILLEIQEALKRGEENAAEQVSFKKNNWNKEPTEKEINSWFQEGYKSYISTHLKNQLTKHTYGVLDESSGSPPNIEASVGYNAAAEKFEIILKSSYVYENVTKEIEAIYRIDIPRYDDAQGAKSLLHQIRWRKLR